MKLAAISNVRGNAWALESVLRDIRGHGVDRIINLGDSLSGPLAPAETAMLLQDPDILSIRGDQDLILSQFSHPAPAELITAFVRSRLTPGSVHWLKNLPPTRIYGSSLYLCHGSPSSDRRDYLNGVSGSGVRTQMTKDLFIRSDGVKQRLILCGHGLSFRMNESPDGVIIVNPGSVGLQACRIVSPIPHIKETGSPHARYSIIYSENHEYFVQSIRVEYDWDSAAAAALHNGFSDWAVWLRTGRAKKEEK